MGSGSIAPPFLTPALDGGEWSASRPYGVTSGETAPGTHWIRGWVGPRAGLGNRTPLLSCAAHSLLAVPTVRITGSG
jgi:hypothetical protein